MLIPRLPAVGTLKYHNLLQVNGKNLVDDPTDTDPNTPKFVPHGGRSNLPLERVTALVVDAFTGATERHIEV